MRRREFIGLVGGAAVAWPLAARAQQKTMPVIGYAAVSMKAGEALLAGVRRGLAELGLLKAKISASSFGIPTVNMIASRSCGGSWWIKRSRSF